MKTDIVNKALMLAGNMPLTEEDKQYNNLPYKYAKELYLSLLFNCLSEIEWRSARRWFPITLSQRYTIRERGMWYYEIPAECVKPVRVEEGDFRQDESFIVCECENSRLWGVFHKRKISFLLQAPTSQRERDRKIYIERPIDREAANNPRVMLNRARSDAEAQALGNSDDDFPDWEETEYEPQFWKYFEYRFAADLSMKLKGDQNLYAQLIAIADKFGEEAIQSSRDAAENESVYLTWLDKVGLHTAYDHYSGLSRRPWGLKTGLH
jgi:hypothetical protein